MQGYVLYIAMYSEDKNTPSAIQQSVEALCKGKGHFVFMFVSVFVSFSATLVFEQLLIHQPLSLPLLKRLVLAEEDTIY